jgi:hypothetical protein
MDARRIFQEAQTDIEKGFFIRGFAPIRSYKDIHLAADPSLNARWATGFVVGATEWNNKTHVVFKGGSPAPSSGLVVLAMGDFGAGFNCLLGITRVLSAGQTSIIAINSGFNCTDPSIATACHATSLAGVSANMVVHIAVHELGHALGFGHSGDLTGGDGIPGTSLGAFDPNTPSYPSAMWGGINGCFTGSGNVTLGVSGDDITAANIMYP